MLFLALANCPNNFVVYDIVIIDNRRCLYFSLESEILIKFYCNCPLDNNLTCGTSLLTFDGLFRMQNQPPENTNRYCLESRFRNVMVSTSVS